MTKKETIKKISEAIGESQKRTTEILDAIQTVVFDGLHDKEEVKLFDGVTFIAKERAARTCRNPQTGESMLVPAKTVPDVKFGKAAKDAVVA